MAVRLTGYTRAVTYEGDITVPYHSLAGWPDSGYQNRGIVNVWTPIGQFDVSTSYHVPSSSMRLTGSIVTPLSDFKIGNPAGSGGHSTQTFSDFTSLPGSFHDVTYIVHWAASIDVEQYQEVSDDEENTGLPQGEVGANFLERPRDGGNLTLSLTEATAGLSVVFSKTVDSSMGWFDPVVDYQPEILIEPTLFYGRDFSGNVGLGSTCLVNNDVCGEGGSDEFLAKYTFTYIYVEHDGGLGGPTHNFFADVVGHFRIVVDRSNGYSLLLQLHDVDPAPDFDLSGFPPGSVISPDPYLFYITLFPLYTRASMTPKYKHRAEIKVWKDREPYANVPVIWLGDYTEAVRYTDSNGKISVALEPHNYDYKLDWDEGSLGSRTVNYWWQAEQIRILQVKIEDAWLLANESFCTDYRYRIGASVDAAQFPFNDNFMLLGEQWDALELSRDSSRTFDGMNLSDWDSPSNENVVLGVNGTALEVTVAGVGGKVVRDFGGGPGMRDLTAEDYRYIHWPVQTDEAGRAITLKINGKIWRHTTPSSLLHTWIIDTCMPDEVSGSSTGVDASCSRYNPPVGEDGISQTNGMLWGISNVATLSIEDLANGGVYQFHGMVLETDGNSKVHFMPNFLYEDPAASSFDHPFGVDDPRLTLSYNATREISSVDAGGAEEDEYSAATFVRRFITGITDHRQVLEYPYAMERPGWGSDPEFPRGPIYYPSIQKIAEWINNEIPAWLATPIAPVYASDNLHHRGREVFALFGGGALWDGTDWTQGFDIPVGTTPVTIKAQDSWFTASFHPQPNDPFNLGGAVDEMVVGAHITLRGNAWGLVSDPQGNPLSGINVKSTQDYGGGGSGVVNTGNGLTDSEGGYETGTPYIRGEKTAEITASTTAAVGEDTASYERLWSSRGTHRVCFRLTRSQSGGFTWDVSTSDRKTRVFQLGENGQMVVGSSIDKLGVNWDERDLGITGYNPHLRYINDPDNTLLMVYDDGAGAVKQARSLDEGLTWDSDAVDVASGERPAVNYTKLGDLIYGWIRGGSVYGKMTNRDGEEHVSEFVISNGDNALGSVNAHDFYLVEGERVIEVTYVNDEGGRSTQSHDNGVTWTPPVTVAPAAEQMSSHVTSDGYRHYVYIVGGEARKKELALDGSVVKEEHVVIAAIDSIGLSIGDFYHNNGAWIQAILYANNKGVGWVVARNRGDFS